MALLARHDEQADLHEEAVDLLSQAAENARSGYNNVEAIDFLARALNIVAKQPQLAGKVAQRH